MAKDKSYAENKELLKQITASKYKECTDERIKGIFRCQKAKMGLEAITISLCVPKDSGDTLGPEVIAYVTGDSSEGYTIHINRTGSSDSELTSTMRHEMAHIKFRDNDKMERMPNRMARILYMIFIAEPRAAFYE